MKTAGNHRLRVRPLAPEYWRPAALLTQTISRELGAETTRPLKTQLAIFASPWLEDGEGYVLTEDDTLTGFGWARDLPWRGRNMIHTGLYLAPQARTPDRYAALTDRLIESARRLARARRRTEAYTFYRSIDTVHPPIIRAIGYRDLPTAMLGFNHDLVRIPDVPPPAGVEIRPARLPDELPLLQALAGRCFDDPATQVGPQHKDYWDMYVPEYLADPELLLIAEADGRPAGYLALTTADAPPGTAKIAEAAVAPEWRRRGITSHLLARALRHCRRRRLRRATLSELSTSPAAALIWRAGFRPDAAQTFYFFGRRLED